MANVSFCAGARVNGSTGLVTVYPEAVAAIVEIVKPALLELVTVTGKVSDFPTTTSPKRKMVGLNVNGVLAEAGVCNTTIDSRALNNKYTYFETDWGRVITFPVCREVSDQ